MDQTHEGVQLNSSGSTRNGFLPASYAKLAPDAYIKLNASYAGSGESRSIAGALATHFRLPVFAFDGGALFYGSPNPVRGSGGTRPPETGPLYLLEDRGTRLVQIRP